MKICGIVLAALYAALILFAVCKEKNKGISSVLMALGSLLIAAYLVSMIWNMNLMFTLIAGMLSISAGALVNGISSKNVHIHHHIIRLAVEAIIVALCWIG